VTTNKVRLVAKGYKQEERIDFDKTFALAAILEVICSLLAFVSPIGSKLFGCQMHLLEWFSKRRSVS